MSASEKLKALDGDLEISESDQLWLDLQPKIVSLRSALPQIVAVVEAAEVTPFAFVENQSGTEAVAVPLADWRKIQTALSALEEALS